MVAEGGRRRSSSAATAAERKERRRQWKQQWREKRREEQRQKKQNNNDEKKHDSRKQQQKQLGQHFSAEDLTSLLSQLTSAAALSLRFLSENDLLLRPSQSLSLEASLHSAALSLSMLHSLLPSSLLKSPATTTTKDEVEDEETPKPSPAPPSPAAAAASDKSHYWFLRFLASAKSDCDPRWLETFRMSRPSFYLLLQTLSPSISSNSAAAAASHIPTDHMLGAALFRLAHASPFRSVARRFGLEGPAVACRSFYEVCRAVTDQLGHLFELTSDLRRVVQGFHWISLPNCCGVLAFSGFPAECDSDPDRPDSVIIVQALVDSEGRFLDVSAGWPGSMLPSQILPRTKLFSSHAKDLSGGGGSSGTPCSEAGNGVAQLRRYFLGDSCCPLLPWLLTPFPDSNDPTDDSRRKVFNDVHARGMELASKAFAAVRARWRLLLTTWRGECVEALPFVIVASCLLHNFLFKCSETMPEDEPEEVVAMREQSFPEFEGKGNQGGERFREVLASHLSSVIHQG